MTRPLESRSTFLPNISIEYKYFEFSSKIIDSLIDIELSEESDKILGRFGSSFENVP